MVRRQTKAVCCSSLRRPAVAWSKAPAVARVALNGSRKSSWGAAGIREFVPSESLF
jgi:hypothetical protein